MRLQFTTAALVAGFLAAGAAQAQTVGHVGASYERMHFDSVGGGNIGKVDGAFGFKSEMVGALVDAEATHYFGGGGFTSYGGSVHLNLHGDAGLIGGFGGVYNAHRETLWMAGVEGQLNLGQVQLYAQGGYGRMDSFGNTDLYGGRIEARYYATDNLKLQASGGYSSTENLGGGRLQFFNAGAEAEFQPNGAPLSVLAAYEYGKIRHTPVTSHTFRLGVRYNFGGTLRERDQAGGSVAPASRLFGGELGKILVSGAGLVGDADF